MKQPWEDIAGSDLGGFLTLSLDDGAARCREALMEMARELRRACLVGNPAPVVIKMRERMMNPVPGDLVVETSRAMHRKDHQGFGILLERRLEGDSPYDDVWYIQYGPDSHDIARWENCEFMALPVETR